MTFPLVSMACTSIEQQVQQHLVDLIAVVFDFCQCRMFVAARSRPISPPPAGGQA